MQKSTGYHIKPGLTTEEFISLMNEVNPSVEILGEYKRSTIKIPCRCKKCGREFLGIPYCMVTRGTGCRECAGSHGADSYRISKEQFLERLHTYPNNIELIGEYNGYSKRCLFRCTKCGREWSTTPQSIIRAKIVCRNCSAKVAGLAKQTSKEEVLERIAQYGRHIAINPDDYVSSTERVKATCEICGHVWYPQVKALLVGSGCPECAHKSRYDAKRTSSQVIDEEIRKATKTLTLVGDFVSHHKPIRVRCTECGSEFVRMPSTFIRGSRCQFCSEIKNSKGEAAINDYLIARGYTFVRQKTFEDCRLKNVLRFDFFLTDFSTCIEFDGKQHFEPIGFFGGEDGFVYTTKKDKIKNEFCQANNIQLIRISYWEFDRIEEILDSALQPMTGGQ